MIRRGFLRSETRKGSTSLRIRTLASAVVLAGTIASFGAGPAAPLLTADEKATADALAALGPGFARSETEHFVILSDGSQPWTRSTASLLETTYDRFTRLMRHYKQPMATPPSKLQCILIENHDRFEAFALAHDNVHAQWMGGYYATHTNRIVFYNAETSPDFQHARARLSELDAQARRAQSEAAAARRSDNGNAEQVYRTLAAQARSAGDRQRRLLADRAAQAGAAKTTHEAAHLLAFNVGLQLRSRQYPFWLSEGLASCFEADSHDAARKGLLGPDRENPVRQREFAAALAEATLIPLEALVEMNKADADEDTARVMYAQANALYRWLYRHERDALAGLYADISREPPGTIPPKRHGELFRARFGDIRKLERRWLRDAGAEALRIASAPDEP